MIRILESLTRIVRSVPTGVGLSRPSAADIQHVIDPDCDIWLVRVVGDTDGATMNELERLLDGLQARQTLHLDLHDARITSSKPMQELERLTDRLERSRIRVRITGLDPDHPLLGARR